MATLTETCKQPVEFVSIVKLVDCFHAMHVDKTGKKQFLSKQPEVDMMIALAAANTFALKNNIPFKGLQKIGPIMTVMKQENVWYLAELHSNEIAFQIDNIRGGKCIYDSKITYNLGKNQEKAVQAANRLTHLMKRDFLPSIGISLTEEQETKAVSIKGKE